jgi:hypothetical protein
MSEGADNDASSSSFGNTTNATRPGNTSGSARLTDSNNNSGFNSQSCQC